MHDPAHNQTCPGTNGSTNTQPHVATEIFCTCFSCGLVWHNGHYKIPDRLPHGILHSHMRLFLHGRLHRTYPFLAYEPAKGEGVCRGIGYTAHEMCTMWLSSAVGSQSQAPLSLLCLDTDSE